MMELGATVCLRQNPLCLACPVRQFCAAARGGKPENLPRFAPKSIERSHVTRVWCERRGALLLHKAHAGARRFANIHELPTVGQTGLNPATVARGKLLAKKRRTITRFQITESIFAVAAPRGNLPSGLTWVPFANLDTITLSGPHRRWVTEILIRRA